MKQHIEEIGSSYRGNRGKQRINRSEEKLRPFLLTVDLDKTGWETFVSKLKHNFAKVVISQLVADWHEFQGAKEVFSRFFSRPIAP